MKTHFTSTAFPIFLSHFIEIFYFQLHFKDFKVNCIIILHKFSSRNVKANSGRLTYSAAPFSMSFRKTVTILITEEIPEPTISAGEIRRSIRQKKWQIARGVFVSSLKLRWKYRRSSVWDMRNRRMCFEAILDAQTNPTAFCYKNAIKGFHCSFFLLF